MGGGRWSEEAATDECECPTLLLGASLPPKLTSHWMSADTRLLCPQAVEEYISWSKAEEERRLRDEAAAEAAAAEAATKKKEEGVEKKKGVPKQGKTWMDRTTPPGALAAGGDAAAKAAGGAAPSQVMGASLSADGATDVADAPPGGGLGDAAADADAAAAVTPPAEGDASPVS